MPEQTILELPARPPKPRETGITAVIDAGLGYSELEGHVEAAGAIIDFVKFGWGTALVTENLARKVDLLRDRRIPFWFGGTLFELAHQQGRVDRLADWAWDMGCEYFEVSDGTIELAEVEKLRHIEELARRFTVVSEVGKKDPEYVMPPSEWIRRLSGELRAGAWKVITEGRESGKAGIYNKAGEVPTALIEDVLASGIPLRDIIFEAPMKAQQVWFLRNVSWEANLGNIAPGDAIKLETLRLGLRGDTMMDRAARLGRMPAEGTGQALLELVRNVLKLPADTPLSDETTAAEVPGWDSIANVNLFMEAQARFRITMDFEALAEIESIGDLRREIEKQTGPLAS